MVMARATIAQPSTRPHGPSHAASRTRRVQTYPWTDPSTVISTVRAIAIRPKLMTVPSLDDASASLVAHKKRNAGRQSDPRLVGNDPLQGSFVQMS